MYSIADWWRLDRDQRSRVAAAVDSGQAADTPELRAIAVALASAQLNESGTRILRRPVPVIAIVLAVGVLVASGYWWLLGALTAVSVCGLWVAERKARRLRPQWRRAVAHNRPPMPGGPSIDGTP